jgi:hypothetical protein
MLTVDRKMFTILYMLTHKCDHDLLSTILIRTHLQLIPTHRLMFHNLSKNKHLLAPVTLITALNFEALQLILERYRYFHHFDPAAPERTQSLKRLTLALPPVDALIAEDVPALGALPGVLQQVLTHLAHEVGPVLRPHQPLYQT